MASKAVDDFIRRYSQQPEERGSQFNSFDESALAPRENGSTIKNLNDEIKALREQIKTCRDELAELKLRFDAHLQECKTVPKRQRNTIEERLISEKITQFLQSWNRSYRCAHFSKQNCVRSLESCTRIHDDVSHSNLAREIRALLLSGQSMFFTSLIERCASFACATVCQQLSKELDFLAFDFHRQVLEDQQAQGSALDNAST